MTRATDTLWPPIIALALVMLGIQPCPAQEPVARCVEIVYSCTIEDVPQGAQAVDLWMPVASDTDGQKVTKAVAVRPEGGNIAAEPRYGNHIYHKRFTGPFGEGHELGAELLFEIQRTEIVVPEAKTLESPLEQGPAEGLAVYLEPSMLIPLDGPIEGIAAELGLEKETPLRAARKIYDYIIDEMTYDWRSEDAGKGDLLWACDTKSGNCTDYHSVFLALCRSRGIPADHEFGFPIRSKRDKGRLPSYHCWARFHVDGIGWIPLDASEADRHPELRAYNFGSQGANLLKFTHGRGIILEPPQQGPPINFFIYPYVEVDGAPHPSVKHKVAFQNLPPAQHSGPAVK